MSTHRHSISLMRYAGRIDQIVLFGYIFQCLKNYSKRPRLRKMLGCMLQKQQVQTQVLSTNCSRISGCLNYLIISKLHFKTVDKKRFLLVCRQANWNHKALYENWLGIFFCFAGACVRVSRRIHPWQNSPQEKYCICKALHQHLSHTWSIPPPIYHRTTIWENKTACSHSPRFLCSFKGKKKIVKLLNYS